VNEGSTGATWHEKDIKGTWVSAEEITPSSLKCSTIVRIDNWKKSTKKLLELVPM
jgi:hypothetical protein